MPAAPKAFSKEAELLAGVQPAWRSCKNISSLPQGPSGGDGITDPAVVPGWEAGALCRPQWLSRAVCTVESAMLRKGGQPGSCTAQVRAAGAEHCQFAVLFQKALHRGLSASLCRAPERLYCAILRDCSTVANDCRQNGQAGQREDSW